MIKVVREGLNPILNQYDYPELNVRIGIDLGENAVVTIRMGDPCDRWKSCIEKAPARHIRIYDEHRNQNDCTRKARSNHNWPISI